MMCESNLKLFGILMLFSVAASLDNNEYDFIIIGAGTAGCTLANRLSEIQEWKILLLEAGHEISYRFLVNMPFAAAILQFTGYNWAYHMEKQPNVGLGQNEQTIKWPRGKGIGGSSLINFMMHIRGNKLDYDRWALQGNTGWSYKEVLPYFKKLENSKVLGDDYQYRGHDGPVYAEYAPYQTKGVHYFVEAAQDTGYSYLDYNGRQQIGVSLIQTTTKNGRRCSAEAAYIKPIRGKRKNLVISANSRVLKILIDPTTKNAYGVSYNKFTSTKTAFATKEVILSAGTINSPQILMLSGIGPKKHLQSFNIPLVKDAPVGELLYDHVVFAGLMYTINDINGALTLGTLANPKTIYDYFIHNQGPLTNICVVEGVCYINTNTTVANASSVPDIEAIYFGGSFQSDDGLLFRQIFNIKPSLYDAIWGPLVGTTGFNVMPLLLHPKSRGRIRLRSANPRDAPLIYGNYYTDPEQQDMKTMLGGIRAIQRIISSKVYNDLEPEIVSRPVPDCAKHGFDSDEYWLCALQYLSYTLYHPTTTCKMGPEQDSEAVVDAVLKVHGINNLRVIDASVIPVTISGHTNVPTYMVAEKGADLIKAHWLNESMGAKP